MHGCYIRRFHKGLKDIHISSSRSFIDIECDHKPQGSEFLMIQILHFDS